MRELTERRFSREQGRSEQGCTLRLASHSASLDDSSDSEFASSAFGRRKLARWRSVARRTPLG